MSPDVLNFLRVLTSNEPGPPVLFMPYIPQYLAEQLIWRRGSHLWETPEAYIDTITSLQEQLHADTAIADSRLFPDDALAAFAHRMEKHADNGVRYVVLCHSEKQTSYFDCMDAVCALGVYGKIHCGKLPVIAMAHTPEEAISAGCAGWFCSNGDGEKYWDRLHHSIAVLGGIDASWIQSVSPVEIYRRIENFSADTRNQRAAIGIGGDLSNESYLQLISLLAIYENLR